MLIDTHTHLNMNEFDPDLEEVGKQAEEVGVTKIIMVVVDMENSRKG